MDLKKDTKMKHLEKQVEEKVKEGITYENAW